VRAVAKFAILAFAAAVVLPFAPAKAGDLRADVAAETPVVAPGGAVVLTVTVHGARVRSLPIGTYRFAIVNLANGYGISLAPLQHQLYVASSASGPAEIASADSFVESSPQRVVLRNVDAFLAPGRYRIELQSMEANPVIVTVAP